MVITIYGNKYCCGVFFSIFLFSLAFEERQREIRKAIERRSLFETVKKPSQDPVEKDSKSTSKLLELANTLNKGNPFDSPVKRITADKKFLGIRKKETPKTNTTSSELNTSDSLSSDEHLSQVNSSIGGKSILEVNAVELISDMPQEVSEKMDSDMTSISQTISSSEVKTNNALTSLICTYSDSEDDT